MRLRGREEGERSKYIKMKINKYFNLFNRFQVKGLILRRLVLRGIILKLLKVGSFLSRSPKGEIIKIKFSNFHLHYNLKKKIKSPIIISI